MESDAQTIAGTSNPGTRMSRLQRGVILVLAVALHLAGDLVAVPIVYRWKLGEWSGGFAALVLFGSLLGQLSMLAAYWAWGCGHWVDRLIKSCFLVVLVWYLVTVGIVSTEDSFEIGSIEQFLALIIAPSFLFLSMAFWLTRVFGRARFRLVSDGELLADASVTRFRVSHLFIWTAAVAVLCLVFQTRIGREVWPSQWSMSNDWYMIVSLMAAWAGLCAVLAIPGVWVCLSPARVARRLLFLTAYGAIVTAIACAVVYASWGSPAIVLAGFALGVTCEAVACRLVLRLAGYRLVRKGQAGSSA
jgi:hypothetical protein